MSPESSWKVTAQGFFLSFLEIFKKGFSKSRKKAIPLTIEIKSKIRTVKFEEVEKKLKFDNTLEVRIMTGKCMRYKE